MTLIKAKKKSAEPEMSTKICIGPPQKGAPSKPKLKKKTETLSPSPTLPPTKQKMYPKNAAAIPGPVPVPVLGRGPVIFSDPKETELVPRKVSEKEEDFETFVRRFKQTSRPKVIESDDKEEFEDDEDQEHQEEYHDEEDYGRYYKAEGVKGSIR